MITEEKAIFRSYKISQLSLYSVGGLLSVIFSLQFLKRFDLLEYILSIWLKLTLLLHFNDNILKIFLLPMNNKKRTNICFHISCFKFILVSEVMI